MKKSLSIFNLSVRNLLHRRVRTTFLIAFVMILSASLFASNILTDSMEKCIDKTVDRIGADVIVTPQEYASELSDSLFSGELCSFYFERSYMKDVEKIEGLEEVSPQLYIATLDASCCSIPVQIVAFDSETDFIVQSWLSGAGIDKLEKGEVIVGSRIASSAGDNIKFFNLDYTVKAKLEETETSYDNCAFMDFETAYTLFKSEQIKYVTDLTEPEKYVSALMIRAKEGANIDNIARDVNTKIPGSGLKAYTAKGMFGKVSNTLGQMQSYSALLIGLLFLMAILALICIFNITVNERLREFGILLSIGARKNQIFKMLLLEAGMIGIVGGILGIILAGGGVSLFSDLIIEKMQLPYLITDVSKFGMMTLKCMGLSVVTSLASTLYAAVKAIRTEPFKLIQEVG